VSSHSDFVVEPQRRPWFMRWSDAPTCWSSTGYRRWTVRTSSPTNRGSAVT